MGGSNDLPIAHLPVVLTYCTVPVGERLVLGAEARKKVLPVQRRAGDVCVHDGLTTL